MPARPRAADRAAALHRAARSSTPRSRTSSTHTRPSAPGGRKIPPAWLRWLPRRSRETVSSRSARRPPSPRSSPRARRPRGRRARGLLKCYAKAALKGVAVDTAPGGCIDQVETEFSTVFGHTSGCTGDQTTIENDVHSDCVDNVASLDGMGKVIDNICPVVSATTTTSAPTTTTSTTTTTTRPPITTTTTTTQPPTTTTSSSTTTTRPPTTTTTTTTQPPTTTTTTQPTCQCHSVCTAGAAECPTDCSDPCVAAVCAQDPTCCDPSFGWTALCVSEVDTFCCPSGGTCCP